MRILNSVLAIAVIFCGCVMFSSCNQDDRLVEGSNSLPANVDINGISIENRNGTLVFENESQVKEVVSKIRMFRPKVLSTRSGGTELIRGFKSLYDVFSDAMNEAESYYERPGGYEEFKKKYSLFYFPEVGDDYSAYLPVSDKNLAKIADVNGNVIIGNETVSVIDVTSYEQLVEMGQTAPETGAVTIKTRATSGVNSIATEETSENKVWVNSYIRPYHKGVTPAFQIEVCFRKKGILGVWYNHNSGSHLVSTNLITGLYFFDDSAVEFFGFSSHDYYFGILTQAIGSGAWTVPLQGNIQIYHQGTNKTLTLTVSRASEQVYTI
jgi:hypothetical protein